MKYDFVFLTNLPAFYKLNLYNAIAKEKNIFVAFIGNDAEIRNEDFFKGEKQFPFISLMNRGRCGKLFYLLRLLFAVKTQYFVLGGWDNVYMWIGWLLIPPEKIAVVVESSYLESMLYGLRGWLKKIFLKKVSLVYASGYSQTKLVRDGGFKGKVIVTKGVGLFNMVEKPEFRLPRFIENFVYVGRLSPEKNLDLLINVFNELPQYNLNIIGFGPLEHELKSMAKRNIIFYGAVENKELPVHYSHNDVFILPSISEPWGMVVEEALNNALPVIVSDRVGCVEEIVKNDCNGIVFRYNDPVSLKNAIIKITNLEYYMSLKKNVMEMDFKDIARRQIKCYTNL